MGGRHTPELFFELEPHGNGIDPDVFASQARQEELPPVLALEQGLEGGRHLQTTLTVNASRRVAPKHAQLLHFWPQNSTRIVEEGPLVVNRNILCRQQVTPYLRFPLAPAVSPR